MDERLAHAIAYRPPWLAANGETAADVELITWGLGSGRKWCDACSEAAATPRQP